MRCKVLLIKRVLLVAWITLIAVFATDFTLMFALPYGELNPVGGYCDPETGIYVDYGLYKTVYWYTPILSAVFNVTLWCMIGLALTSVAYKMVSILIYKKTKEA